MLLKRIFIIVILCLCKALAEHSPGNQLKPTELVMLALLPITGDSPRTGEGCRIAMDIVKDRVNGNTDLLPDFHVRLVYSDEGSQGELSTSAAMTFRRNYESNETIVMSPLILGGYFSAGCFALARHVHHHDMALLAVSCTSPQGTNNRRIYPNFYRTKSSGELVAFPQLRFIRDIGGWQRFGIISNAGFLFDYSLATYLSKIAIREGFEVPVFDCATEFDDNMAKTLRDSGTRIVVVDTSLPFFAIQFLCQTYKFGITGSAFVFIIHTAAYFNTISLEEKFLIPGCSRNVLLSQMKYTFWIGWSLTPSRLTVESIKHWPMDLSIKDFDAEFDRRSKGKKPQDYDKRFNCADVAYQGVMALDSANKQLEKLGMSLRGNGRNSKQVIDAVNKSLAKSDYFSYRIGQFSYSPRLELDMDVQDVVQVLPQGESRHLTDIMTNSQDWLQNYSNYRVRVNLPPVWFTKDGKPPKDRATIYSITSAMPAEYFGVSIALATVVLFVQICTTCRYLIKRLPNSMRALIFGCSALTISSGLYSASATFKDNVTLCVLERCLTLIGFGLSDGFVFSHMYALKSCKLVKLCSRRKKRLGKAKICASNSMIERYNNIKVELRSFASLVIIILLTLAYLVLWMLTDTPVVNLISSTSKIAILSSEEASAAYDFLVTNTVVCQSLHEEAWVLSIFAAHVLLLFTALFLCYAIIKRRHSLAVSDSQFKPVMLAGVNLATSIIAGGLLLTLFRSTTSKLVVLSLISLSSSTATFGIIFKSFFQARPLI